MSGDKKDSFKDTIENNDFSVIDIHKIGLRLARENKKQYTLLLLKIAVVIGLYFTMLLNVSKLNLTRSSRVIFTMIPIGVVSLIIVTVAMTWFCGNTIVKINTGIDIIEDKKVAISKYKVIWRLVALCTLGYLIIFLVSIGYVNSDFILSKTPVTNEKLYFMIDIVLVVLGQIIALMLYCYYLFILIEIMAKGNTVIASIKNAYRNIFYSENKLAKRILAGGVLNIMITFSINGLNALFMYIITKTPIINHVHVYSILVTISIIIVTILLFLVNLFYLQYMYLVYMSNKVKDKKVYTDKENTEENI